MEWRVYGTDNPAEGSHVKAWFDGVISRWTQIAPCDCVFSNGCWLIGDTFAFLSMAGDKWVYADMEVDGNGQ